MRIVTLRPVLPIGILLVGVAAASAQTTPLSGPNTSIASPICDVINFGFCPQPAPPPPPLPDVNEPVLAQRTPPPVAPMHRRHRWHRHPRSY